MLGTERGKRRQDGEIRRSAQVRVWISDDRSEKVDAISESTGLFTVEDEGNLHTS